MTHVTSSSPAQVIYPVILDHQLPSMRYNAFMVQHWFALSGSNACRNRNLTLCVHDGCSQFVAPLRFLRLRRALQSLDNIRGGQPVRFLRCKRTHSSKAEH